MKKKIKLVGWSILGILLIAVATLLLARFVFNKQVEAYLCNSLKNEMVEKIKTLANMYQILRPIILHIRKILSNHKKSVNISNSIQFYLPQCQHGTRPFHWHVL